MTFLFFLVCVYFLKFLNREKSELLGNVAQKFDKINQFSLGEQARIIAIKIYTECTIIMSRSNKNVCNVVESVASSKTINSPSGWSRAAASGALRNLAGKQSSLSFFHFSFDLFATSWHSRERIERRKSNRPFCSRGKNGLREKRRGSRWLSLIFNWRGLSRILSAVIWSAKPTEFRNRFTVGLLKSLINPCNLCTLSITVND